MTTTWRRRLRAFAAVLVTGALVIGLVNLLLSRPVWGGTTTTVSLALILCTFPWFLSRDRAAVVRALRPGTWRAWYEEAREQLAMARWWLGEVCRPVGVVTARVTAKRGVRIGAAVVFTGAIIAGPVLILLPGFDPGYRRDTLGLALVLSALPWLFSRDGGKVRRVLQRVGLRRVGRFTS